MIKAPFDSSYFFLNPPHKIKLAKEKQQRPKEEKTESLSRKLVDLYEVLQAESKSRRGLNAATH